MPDRTTQGAATCAATGVPRWARHAVWAPSTPQLRPGGTEFGLDPLSTCLLVAHQPAEGEAVAAFGWLMCYCTQLAQQPAVHDGVLVLAEQLLDGFDLLDQPIGRPSPHQRRSGCRGRSLV